MGKIWVSPDNGCWLDLYEVAGHRGHVERVRGPVAMPHLRLAGLGWTVGDQARSLVVGPNAYVQCYEELDFNDSVFWLLPNQRVDDVAGLPCGEEIDSVVLYDRPPFAHEPGYAAYMLWAASHITRTPSANGTADRGRPP